MRVFDPADDTPPLVQAIEEGNLAEVRRIVAENPRVIDDALAPDTPEHPLHYAIWQGKPDVVAFLLEHNADVNAVGENGDTPLHYAAKHGYPDFANLLIERGANVNAENEGGFTPLLVASRGREQECEQVIDLLERSGAIIGLNEWICMGRLEEVRRILESDSHACRTARFPGYLIEDMITLIQCRMWKKAGHFDGADPAAEDEVTAETLPVLRQMLDQGADPNGGFSTAVFYAVQLPRTDFARLLLERGASTEQLKKFAESGHEVAQRSDMKKMLREFGL